MTANEEEIYKKVAETLKLTGSGDVRSISVSTFKGTEDCQKRLEQIADHLDASLRIDYNKIGDNSYSVLISGFPCDLVMPFNPSDEGGSFTTPADIAETAAAISQEYNLDQKEVEIFLSTLPHVAEDPLKKDDFWGWMYRCGCDCAYSDFITWEDVFADLIAPGCENTIVFTVEERHYVTTKTWDPTWADGKGGWDLVEDEEEEENEEYEEYEENE